MHIHSQRRATGFTLIEIVIVLVILAGIMAMVGPRIFDGLGRAKAKQARAGRERDRAELMLKCAADDIEFLDCPRSSRRTLFSLFRACGLRIMPAPRITREEVLALCARALRAGRMDFRRAEGPSESGILRATEVSSEPRGDLDRTMVVGSL